MMAAINTEVNVTTVNSNGSTDGQMTSTPVVPNMYQGLPPHVTTRPRHNPVIVDTTLGGQLNNTIQFPMQHGSPIINQLSYPNFSLQHIAPVTHANLLQKTQQQISPQMQSYQNLLASVQQGNMMEQDHNLNVTHPAALQDPSIIYSSMMDTKVSFDGMQTTTNMLCELKQQNQEIHTKLDAHAKDLHAMMDVKCHDLQAAIDKRCNDLDAKITSSCEDLRTELMQEVSQLKRNQAKTLSPETIDKKLTDLQEKMKPCSDLEKKVILNEVDERCRITLEKCDEKLQCVDGKYSTDTTQELKNMEKSLLKQVDEKFEIIQTSLKVDIVDHCNVARQQS